MFESLEKLRKRLILENNKFRANMAENITELTLAMQGYRVRKVHKGKDFIAEMVNPFTGEVIERKYVEVKTGPFARLSEAQKRSKARSKNYEVWWF